MKVTVIDACRGASYHLSCVLAAAPTRPRKHAFGRMTRLAQRFRKRAGIAQPMPIFADAARYAGWDRLPIAICGRVRVPAGRSYASFAAPTWSVPTQTFAQR